MLGKLSWLSILIGILAGMFVVPRVLSMVRK